MGCGAVVRYQYREINDRFQHVDDITEDLQKSGLTDSQLVIGIDFSKSNIESGTNTFPWPHSLLKTHTWPRCLHDVGTKNEKNPYEQVFTMIAESLFQFDTDQLFPVYGFGDALTGSDYVFSFEPYDRPVAGLEGAVTRYRKLCKQVTLGGPTSYAPLIRQTIAKLRESAAYEPPTFHILLIITDGQTSQSDKLDTECAIAEASYYPMSIICIGVGDGPWDSLEKYDDKVRARQFDNFQFMNFNTVFQQYPYIKRKDAFATHALQEVPDQYRCCRALGYLKNDWDLPTKFKCPPRPMGPPDAPNVGDPAHGVVEGWTAVHHHVQKKFFYMSKVTGETLWDKPVMSIYRPPRPEDDDHMEEDDIMASMRRPDDTHDEPLTDVQVFALKALSGKAMLGDAYES